MICPACQKELGPEVHRGVLDYEHGLGQASFRACLFCGLLVQYPAPTAEELERAYPPDYRPHAASGLLKRLSALQAGRTARALAPWLPSKDRPILELGCGLGHLLHELARRGFNRLEGIDRNPKLAENFLGSAIRFEARDLEEWAAPEGSYAAVLLIHFIEHLQKPEEFLARCRDALSGGGKVLIATPSARSLCHAVFGRYWSGLHAPRHTRVYTPESLAILARRLGFSEREFFFKADPASWALSFQNRVAPGPSPWLGASTVPLWIVPAWLECALGRGQALFAVLTR